VAGLWASLSQPARLAVGAAIAAVVLAVLGLALAKSGNEYVVVLVVAGAAVAFAVASSRWSGPPWPVTAATTALAGAWSLALLAALSVVELLFDLDDVDDWGGPVGAVVTVALGAAAIAAVLGIRGGALPDAGTPLPTPATIARPASLAFVGLAAVAIGWLGMISISIWSLQSSAILLACLVVAAIATMRPSTFKPLLLGTGIAVLTLVIAAVQTFERLGSFVDVGNDIELSPIADWLPFALFILGVIAIAVGTILQALFTLAPAPSAGGSASGDG
jgi:hypothetical protein